MRFITPYVSRHERGCWCNCYVPTPGGYKPGKSCWISNLLTSVWREEILLDPPRTTRPSRPPPSLGLKKMPGCYQKHPLYAHYIMFICLIRAYYLNQVKNILDGGQEPPEYALTLQLAQKTLGTAYYLSLPPDLRRPNLVIYMTNAFGYHHNIFSHFALPNIKWYPNFVPPLIFTWIYNTTYLYRYMTEKEISQYCENNEVWRHERDQFGLTGNLLHGY